MIKTEERVTINGQNKTEKTIMPPDEHWRVIVLLSKEWNVALL